MNIGLLPDDPEGFIPQPTPTLDFPVNALASANALIGEIVALVRKPLAEALESAESLAAECRACCEGSLEQLAQNAESCLRKCAGKLEKACWDRLQSAYAAIVNAAGNFPTQEDVIYGLETSDYLGSVGFRPRTYGGTDSGGNSPNVDGTGPELGQVPFVGTNQLDLPDSESDPTWGGNGSVSPTGSGTTEPVRDYPSWGSGGIPQNASGYVAGTHSDSVSGVLAGKQGSPPDAPANPQDPVIPTCPDGYTWSGTSGGTKPPDAPLPQTQFSRILPVPGGPCCIEQEDFRLASGYSTSGGGAGIGIPWAFGAFDVPPNGYMTAAVRVCDGQNVQLVGVAWPNGAYLAVNESGGLIYTFSLANYQAAPCIEPGTMQFVPPGQGPNQPPPGQQNPGCTRETGWSQPWDWVFSASWDNLTTTTLPNGCFAYRPFKCGWGVPPGKDYCFGSFRVNPCTESQFNKIGACYFQGDTLVYDDSFTIWAVKNDCAEGMTGPGAYGFTCYPGGTMPPTDPNLPPGTGEPPVPPGCQPVCEIPQEENCGNVGMGGGPKPPNVGNPSSCEDWERFLSWIISAGIEPGKAFAFNAEENHPEGLPLLIINALTGRSNPILSTIVGGIARTLGKFGKEAAEMTGCDPIRLTPVVLTQAVVDFMERWTGAMPQALIQRLQYTANIVCQYLMPSAADADAAYMTGEIDRETWECWQKLNGIQIPEAEKVLNSKRTKPNVHEIITLNVRGKIDDEETRKRLRNLGVTDDSDASHFKALIEAFPAIDDVFRFMVRDVADEKIVKKFQLDDFFTDKWQGRLKKYATAQGISDELAKDMWRAHWQYPSNTQAFEALHKLRPDKPGIDPNIATTAEDIKTLITANDMSPFWVERLMASSYHTLTRVDTTRAYELGVLDKQGVISSYQDGGYNKANASILADVAEVNYKRKRRNALGLPTAKVSFKAFVANEITQFELEQTLLAYGYKEEELPEVIVKAHEMRELARRRRRLATVRKSYLRGGIDETMVLRLLNELGLDADQVSYHVEDWTYQKKAETKLASLAQLCTWHSNSLISSEDYLTRIRNLGFAPEDVGRIAQSCGIVASEKERKAAEKAAKAQEAANAKIAAANAKRQKEAEANLAKAKREHDEADLLGAKMVDKIEKTSTLPSGSGGE
jgi:hypothetical protein